MLLVDVKFSSWCHVMEHESFESERIASLLSENYVAIKVDREERPDVDKIYMVIFPPNIVSSLQFPF